MRGLLYIECNEGDRIRSYNHRLDSSSTTKYVSGSGGEEIGTAEIKEKNKPRTSLNGTASSEQFKTEEESNEKLDYPQIVLEKVTSTKWDWTKDVASNIKELKDRVAHLEAKTDELQCKKPADEIKDGTTKGSLKSERAR